MLELFYDQDDAVMSNMLAAVPFEDSTYLHKFGGIPPHSSIIPPEGTAPWQLLYTIDLADPAISLEIPGCRFLCLYNAFQYERPLIQYRLKSDSEVEFIYQDDLKVSNDAPFLPDGKYPDVLPESKAILLGEPEEVVFDEELEEFWLDELEDQEDAASSPDRNQLCALYGGVSQMQIFGHTKCKACGETMDYLASVRGEPEKDVISLWGGEEYVLILYQICPACYTIESVPLVN
ncbi:MAG: hypothetical protein CME31_27810 [Gimesia sp.]|uniref:DUF1963 domain-containing protein n=1 Tax=Gimesia maris TaxID=122 RepID=A0A3D3QZ75_9PLAN|nr:hypothetical protein [Gimesia sp.]HCO21646.1 hypothetical protein [Gimesia maris]|tara:strand:+ start:109184 stop:109885 length:702 start_codon:yes stop_codon:yes gene_type:complete